MIDGGSSSSSEVAGKSAGDISLAAICGAHCCGALEALVLTCGPLLPLTERQLVEQIVAVGLAQLSTSANRTLRRPIASSTDAAAGSSSIGSGLTGGGGNGGSSNKWSAALCGGVGSQGEAFRSALITLASALVQSPRGDGSGSGLAPLLSDACHSLSSGGAWAASFNNGGLSSQADAPIGLARTRALSVLEMVHHPRALPLAAPHFWPTTSGSLSRGLTSAASTRTLPLPRAEGGPAETAAVVDGAGPAEVAQGSTTGGGIDDEDNQGIELGAVNKMLDIKRQRTAEPNVTTALAPNTQGSNAASFATITGAAASAPVKTAAKVPMPPLAMLNMPLAAKAAPEKGEMGEESDDGELPDIVDSGPDDSDMEA